MEQNRTQQPLLAEKAFSWLTGLYRANRLPFLSALLFGLLAHGFAFTNKLINHDEAGQLFLKGETVSSGRWGLAVMDSIFPNYSMPWIYGLITIFLFSVSVCLILRIFSIRSRPLQVLLPGLILAFPSLTGTFAFMFTATSYAVSFLLASLALWCVTRKELHWGIPGLALMILSLSIYQSYISVAAGLLVVLLIRQLLMEEDVPAVLLRGIYYLLFLVAALAAYFVASKLVLALKHMDFNTYAAGAMSEGSASIFSKVALAYTNFFRFFTESFCGLIPVPVSGTLHCILLLFLGAMLLVWLVRPKNREPLRILLLVVLLALLPLAINCMYLIVAQESVHTLVLYGFISFYVLLAVVIEAVLPLVLGSRIPEIARRCLLDGAVLVFSLVVLVNTYVANASYLNLYLSYENAYAFYSSLITQLQTEPDFGPDTRLAVVGYYSKPSYRTEHFEFIGNMGGVTGFLPDSYSKAAFVHYYMGLELPFASEEEIAGIRQTQQFRDMPCYPYYGSTCMIDGILVVKLSD